MRDVSLGVVLAAVFLVAVSAQQPTTAAVIRGLVVDARDNTPIRKVSVRLQGGPTTLTGDDGRFEISGAPSGTQELYLSVVDFILVKRTIEVPAGGVIELTIPIAPGSGTYTENITVRPPAGLAPVTPAVAEQSLPNSELQQLRGLITNDPFMADRPFAQHPCRRRRLPAGAGFSRNGWASRHARAAPRARGAVRSRHRRSS